MMRGKCEYESGKRLLQLIAEQAAQEAWGTTSRRTTLFVHVLRGTGLPVQDGNLAAVNPILKISARLGLVI
jgi:hypothetical protein